MFKDTPLHLTGTLSHCIAHSISSTIVFPILRSTYTVLLTLTRQPDRKLRLPINFGSPQNNFFEGPPEPL